MVVGPFSITQHNPTQPTTDVGTHDPTRPNPTANINIMHQLQQNTTENIRKCKKNTQITNFRYQTGISLFAFDCSHLVSLAVVRIQVTVSNYVVVVVVVVDDDDDDDDDDFYYYYYYYYYYEEIGDLHIFAFSDIFSCALLQLMHSVDV